MPFPFAVMLGMIRASRMDDASRRREDEAAVLLDRTAPIPPRHGPADELVILHPEFYVSHPDP